MVKIRVKIPSTGGEMKNLSYSFLTTLVFLMLFSTRPLPLSAIGVEKRDKNSLITSHNLYYYNQRNIVNDRYRSTDKYNNYGPTYYRYNQIREQEQSPPHSYYYYELPQHSQFYIINEENH